MTQIKTSKNTQTTKSIKYMVVIPARAGSVGVKRKNTRDMSGLPLFLWSVNHALGSSKIDKVVVSTNDEAVCDIMVKTYEFNSKIQLLRRPNEISTGKSASEEALIHAVEQQYIKPDFIIMLQPTSPFRFNNLIDRCIKQMEEENADCLLTVTKMCDFFWYEKKNSLDRYEWQCDGYIQQRRMKQAVSREQFKYFDNGCVYITNTDVLLETKNRLNGKVSVYPISPIEAIQIDTEEEFKQCEIIFRGLKEMKNDM